MPAPHLFRGTRRVRRRQYLRTHAVESMTVACTKGEFGADAGTGKAMDDCLQCGVIYRRAALTAAPQKRQEASRA